MSRKPPERTLPAETYATCVSWQTSYEKIKPCVYCGTRFKDDEPKCRYCGGPRN